MRANGKGLEGGDRIGEKRMDRSLIYEYINEGVLWQEKILRGRVRTWKELTRR